MPVRRKHIPTKEDFQKWEHLQDLPLPQVEGEIGLLIGNAVADAFTPYETITGPRGSPHAVRTAIGWIVWNVVRHNGSEISSRRPVNRAELAAIQDMEQVGRMMARTLVYDFPEQFDEDRLEPSQEDKLFIKLTSETTRFHEGHYEVGLPIRDDGRKLPDNRNPTMNRLQGLRKKLKGNPKFYKDYKNFMTDMMEKGYAETPDEVMSRKDGRVWYIPHHGVYHPKKPDKIRVVFDCSSKFFGVCLNDILLQGPDLANSLVGVLLRFHQDPVAFMADIKAISTRSEFPPATGTTSDFTGGLTEMWRKNLRSTE
ncbi:PREDICTED: uncharacterized protein LOC106816214 [Priapulus caudatus]|uniref:Uncharacterized protein LOC106816214 n=1 Tax=Priapulus caudatus TaxID=37621 RepID=A0ABM1EVQ4_PRICU|nr:PREDICTED: uncharacterized protein LOC106816214 [Priapulus caudatus]